MKITRRQFLKGALATGVALSLPLKFGVRSAHAFYQSPGIPLFGTDLRGLGTIPVAAPDAFAAPVTGVTHYTININEFFDQITPASTGLLPTTLWGYQPVNPLLPSVSTQRHLGGIIVGQKGNPIQITFKNNLPPIHPLPVDTTIRGRVLVQTALLSTCTAAWSPGSATADRLTGSIP
jgi:spore coat protein A